MIKLGLGIKEQYKQVELVVLNNGGYVGEEGGADGQLLPSPDVAPTICLWHLGVLAAKAAWDWTLFSAVIGGKCCQEAGYKS